MEIGIREIPNIYEQKAKDLEQKLEQTEVLVLGSSHTFNAINPIYFTNTSIYNAAIPSQPLMMDWQVLKHYEAYTTHLKWVIIPISYFSLYWCLDEDSEEHRLVDYVTHYNIINSGSIKHHSELLSYNLHHNTLRLVKYYYKQEPTYQTNAYGWNEMYSSTMDSIHTNQNAVNKHKQNIQSPVKTKNVQILKEVLAWAKTKNIKTLFVTTPTAPNYYQHLDQDQYQDLLKTVDELTAQNPNSYYKNDIDNQQFYYTDFYDSDHLNAKGAEKYTHLLQQYLQELTAQQ